MKWLAQAVLFAAAVALLAQALLKHSHIVRYPWPLQTAEGSMLASTDHILHSENPYSLDSRPSSINMYGLLYPVLCAVPSAMAPGHGLQIHRAVAAIFIFLSCALMFFAALNLGSGFFLALILALDFYATQLFFGGPLARPDSLGQFLFLSSIFCALFFGHRLGMLMLAADLAIAAFFAKPYFILALPLILLWLLYARRFRDAAFLFFSSATLMLALCFFTAIFCPAYFYETVLIQLLDASYVASYMGQQLSWLALQYQPGLAIALGLCAVLALRGSNAEKTQAPRFSALLIFALAGTALFIFQFGGHIGNFGTYFLQLALPFWLLLCIPYWKSDAQKLLLASLLLISCGLSLRHTPAMSSENERAVAAKWGHMEELIQQAGSENTLLGNDWAAWMLARGLKPVDAGQAKYSYRYAMIESPLLKRLFPRSEELFQGYINSLVKQRTELWEKKYKLVIRRSEEFDGKALEGNYRLKETVVIPYYFIGSQSVEIWARN